MEVCVFLPQAECVLYFPTLLLLCRLHSRAVCSLSDSSLKCGYTHTCMHVSTQQVFRCWWSDVTYTTNTVTMKCVPLLAFSLPVLPIFLELVLALIRPLKLPASSHNTGVESGTLELVLMFFSCISCRAGGLRVESPSVVLLLLGCYCRSPACLEPPGVGRPSAVACWGHLQGPESFEQSAWVVGTGC